MSSPLSSGAAGVWCPWPVLLATLVALAASCDDSGEGSFPPQPSPPAGAPVLAIEVNHPSDLDHSTQIERIKALGASGTALTAAWSTLEPSSGRLDVSAIASGMEFYRSRGISVLLSVPTIDTVERRLPFDLSTLPMDDPRVIERFRALLFELLAHTGEELDYLVIGNEVDEYLNRRPQEDWDRFQTFVKASVDFVKQVRPEVEVGVSVTFPRIMDDRVAAIVESTDVAILTYYFIEGERPEPLAVELDADFGRMLAFAGTRDLVIKELGYPTSGLVGGSPDGQAEFIREVFARWSSHRDRIPFLLISRLFDDDRSTCEDTAARVGLEGHEAFIQFICSLGYRTIDDMPKPAWEVLKASAAAFGL